MRMTIFAVAGAALALTSIQASAQNRMPRECRQQIVKLCGMDREKIRGCLREKYTELSETCQTELRQRMQERRQNRENSGGGLRQNQEAPAQTSEDD